MQHRLFLLIAFFSFSLFGTLKVGHEKRLLTPVHLPNAEKMIELGKNRGLQDFLEKTTIINELAAKQFSPRDIMLKLVEAGQMHINSWKTSGSDHQDRFAVVRFHMILDEFMIDLFRDIGVLKDLQTLGLFRHSKLKPKL